MAKSPKSETDAIKLGLTFVTKEWTKQRKAEERNANAVFGRSSLYERMYNMTIEEAADDVMEEAYLAASDNGKLPVKARQIMYAARPKILEMTGRSSMKARISLRRC
jgi:hypothetical protein